MPSRTQQREEFAAILARELPDTPIHHVTELAGRLVRASTTLTRLAEAACNGDYPCDNGERKVLWCDRCEGGFVRSAMKRIGIDTVKGTNRYLCIDCRTQDRVTAVLKPFNIEPIFAGDPRGCVLKLKVPSGKTNDFGREGICVP